MIKKQKNVSRLLLLREQTCTNKYSLVLLHHFKKKYVNGCTAIFMFKEVLSIINKKLFPIFLAVFSLCPHKLKLCAYLKIVLFY